DLAVDRAGAFVMQFGVGDGGAVDLGFEESQKHVGGPQAAGESASGLDSTRWRALLLSGNPFTGDRFRVRGPWSGGGGGWAGTPPAARWGRSLLPAEYPPTLRCHQRGGVVRRARA